MRHKSNQTIRAVLIIGVMVAMVLSACRPDVPVNSTPSMLNPTNTPIPPTATPLPPRLNLPYTPVPLSVLSPIVVQHSPEPGERLNPAKAIEIVFDRAMDQKSVESAFKVQPQVAGTFAWLNARTLSFKPASALPRNATVDVALTQDAKAADGAVLREPYQFRFATQGNLEVGQTIPARDTIDANPDTIITVLFNHAVIPLTTLNEMAGLPQPMSFEPAIEGKAEWLNTSILVFRPAKPLSGGTIYKGRIAADLKDVEGNPMASEYTWTFSTSAPKVLDVMPRADDQPARIDTAVTVVFNQNVDTASAQAAFALVNGSGNTVAGQTVVLSDTLVFTPTAKLAFDTAYTIRVAAGVKSSSGGNGSVEAWESVFKTVPLPRIIGTIPANGSRDASEGAPFVIQFNTDIDPATVMPHFSMTPPLSPSKVYSFYNSYDHSFIIYFGAEAASDYRAAITPGIADPYGNTIDQTINVAFHTGNLDSSAYIAIPNGVATLNATLPARLVATVVNIRSLNFALSSFEPQSPAYLMRSQADMKTTTQRTAIRSWQQKINVTANKAAHIPVDLAPDGGKLPPGAYYLEVTSPDIPADRFDQRMVLIVSEINLTMKSEPSATLVWATDLQTGNPVGQLPVTFFGIQYNQTEEVFTIGTSTTDDQGVAQVGIDKALLNNTSGIVMAITSGRYGAISNSWTGGVNIYDFNLPTARSYGFYGDANTNLRAYAYTDRPIYRPGQQVFMRGIVRSEDDVRYALPPAAFAVHVRIDDARGQSILDKQLPTDAYGAFTADVVLAAGAPLGPYNISVETETGGIAYIQFTVSAYRPPEYEATVTPSSSEVVRGSTLTTTIEAKYLSGGGMSNAAVQWNVLAQPTQFTPPQFDRYTFSDNDNPWYCFICWRYDGYRPAPQPLFSGSGSTDAQGKLELTLPISLNLRTSAQELISGLVSLSIEANVSGADNQIIAGRASVMVHPAAYYLGIAFSDYVIKASQPATVEVVAIDWQGARLAGKHFDAQVVRREWKNDFDEASGRWSFTTDDIPVTTLSGVTDDLGNARVTFTVPKAGTYKVIVRGQDDAGRIIQSSRFVWATGNEFVPWLRENNDRINLIANKVTYVPGDTADILIPSPFEGEQVALITVERGHILQHEVIAITSNTQVYHLPITNQHVPNVFVSVVLFKGAGGDSAASALTGRPDFKVGYINLLVQPVAQVISITLTPDQPLAQPGQTINYTLQASDSSGRPVQAAFSLDLVDKGILNLMPREKDAIVGAFYGERGTRVQTTSGLSLSANRITEEIEQLYKQQTMGERGGGVSASDTTATAAPAATSAPAAANAAPLRASKASESAPGNVLEVRENFADTAYWTASITTDAQGKATVAIKLPDNLTTWVLRAVGVDSDTRVGEGTVNVVATKPLLIRPVTPRFLVVGDVVELGAIVNNNTDTPQTAVIALAQSDGISLTTPSSQEVTIPAQGEATMRWTATVGQVDSIGLVFSVSNAQYSDASKPRLSTAPNGGIKVNRYSAPEVVGTAGDLDQGGNRTEIVALPPRLDASQGALTVRLDPSLAASMQAGLMYLENYPYENAEAVLSRFLPNVLNYQALREFSIRDSALEGKLQALVSDGLVKLTMLQNSDGGWAWWRDMESNPHISAYIVFGLVRARDAGFTIDNDTLERGLSYLQSTLRDISELHQYYEFNQQAYVLWVMSEAGRANAQRIDALYDVRDKLSLYGRGVVALTIGNVAGKQDARLKTLFADLNGKVVQSATGAHWEEQYNDWWAMNTDTRSTAIILSAMAKLDPANKLAPNVVRWLMASRRDGYWNSTQETAWSLIGLTDWVRATGELKADYEYTAVLNDRGIAQGRATAQTITQTTVVNIPIAQLLRDTGNRLTILRGDGPGRLYYTAHLKAYLPVPSVKAADRGLQVLRRYTLASCDQAAGACPEVTSAQVGDVIRVNLTLIAPSELHYLQLEDPIPAGAEIVDTALATTSQLAEGPSLQRSGASPYWWWWHWYSRSELRDDRVALFAGYLSKGTYEYSYTFRATTPGQFNVIPAFGNEQYFPEVFGRSDGALFTITAK